MENEKSISLDLNINFADREILSYLVAKTLGGNNGDLIADALVGLEVESQLGVVALNDDLSGALHGLGTDATHFGGLLAGWMFNKDFQLSPTVNGVSGCFRLLLCGSEP